MRGGGGKGGGEEGEGGSQFVEEQCIHVLDVFRAGLT